MNRPIVAGVAAVAGVVLSSASALADDETPKDAVHSPGFVMIDRFDAASRVGADITYLFLDGGNDGTTILRFNLAGRYVDPKKHLGGYVQVPFVHGSGNGASNNALGDLEVGFLAMPNLGSNLGMVLRAGITAPTADNAPGDAVFNVVTSVVRLSDLYQALPRGITARLGVSPVYRSGNVFARVDVGLDLNLYEKIDGADSDTADALIRIDAAVGVDLGSLALGLELANAYLNNSNLDGIGNKMINVAAVSARARLAAVHPYGGLIIPLDDDSTQIINAAVTVGVEFDIN